MKYYIEKGKEEDWEDAMALAYRTFQKYVARMKQTGLSAWHLFVPGHISHYCS